MGSVRSTTGVLVVAVGQATRLLPHLPLEPKVYLATIGFGTVAGGVLGGVLGNQVGGGNGKTAMTVLGAAGGAYAGNTVEKNMKKVTLYQMRVRMNNGSVRTIEQASPVATGSSVVVQGNSLRLAR